MLFKSGTGCPNPGMETNGEQHLACRERKRVAGTPCRYIGYCNSSSEISVQSKMQVREIIAEKWKTMALNRKLLESVTRVLSPSTSSLDRLNMLH
jgi:hypothetical protein